MIMFYLASSLTSFKLNVTWSLIKQFPLLFNPVVNPAAFPFFSSVKFALIKVCYSHAQLWMCVLTVSVTSLLVLKLPSSVFVSAGQKRRGRGAKGGGGSSRPQLFEDTSNNQPAPAPQAFGMNYGQPQYGKMICPTVSGWVRDYQYQYDYVKLHARTK